MLHHLLYNIIVNLISFSCCRKTTAEHESPTHISHPDLIPCVGAGASKGANSAMHLIEKDLCSSFYVTIYLAKSYRGACPYNFSPSLPLV